MKNDGYDGQSGKNQPRFIDLGGQQIQVTEEVYQAYKRPRWAESKRRDRWSRCRKPDGNRCESDCKQCPQQRSGSILSLEQSLEENGFELIDDSVDVEAIVFNRLLLKQVMCHLAELDPDSRRIFRLISQDVSEREIAAVIGISQSTFNYRKNKLFEELRNFLKDCV